MNVKLGKRVVIASFTKLPIFMLISFNEPLMRKKIINSIKQNGREQQSRERPWDSNKIMYSPRIFLKSPLYKKKTRRAVGGYSIL